MQRKSRAQQDALEGAAAEQSPVGAALCAAAKLSAAAGC